MKYKKLILLLLILLVIPIVHAQEEEEKCGITNLATCIPQKLYEYTLSIINAPLQPFLDMIKDFLSEAVNINPFSSLWAIIIYIISMFYGLFLLFAGFNFMISGYSAEKRERAKEWLRNIILMIVLVQGSFYLYSLILEIGASLTAGVINLIDENFFLLTIDNLANIGLELILAIPYLITLLTSVILLALRYLIVAVGVIFFPIGLFLHFIPPLKSYGKLVINFLLIIIFLPFIQGLVLLAASKLIEISVFKDVKIVIMISAFTFVNLIMIGLAFFVIIKAAMPAVNKVTAVVKTVGALG